MERKSRNGRKSAAAVFYRYYKKVGVYFFAVYAIMLKVLSKVELHHSNRRLKQ